MWNSFWLVSRYFTNMLCWNQNLFLFKSQIWALLCFNTAACWNLQAITRKPLLPTLIRKGEKWSSCSNFFLLHTLLNQMWAELWFSHLKKPHPKVEVEELWSVCFKAAKGMDPGGGAEGPMKHVVFGLFFEGWLEYFFANLLLTP